MQSNHPSLNLASIAITAIILLASAHPGCAADASVFSPAGTAMQIAADYTRATDEILLDALSAKTPVVVEAETIVKLRTSEFDLASFVSLEVIRGADVPPLLFAKGKPMQSLREVPGRIIENRLERVGVDLLDLSWTNSVFQFNVASPKTGKHGTFAASAPSSTFPATNDFIGANAYAMYLAGQRRFSEAGTHFLAAATRVPHCGTNTREWEFECLASAAACQVLSGDFVAAKNLMITAAALSPQSEMSARARFMSRLFRVNDAAFLPPEVAAMLPAELCQRVRPVSKSKGI